MKELGIVVQQFSKIELELIPNHVFKYRELIVEVSPAPDPESKPEYRFKIGDGVTPFVLLPYVSTLNSLVPLICFYNNDGTSRVALKFSEE